MIGRVVPVGLLTSFIKELFEADPLLSDLWVEGEVSNLFRAQSGHVYFTLKDEEAQIKCALFRTHAARQRWLLAPGDAVAAHGRVTVYERDGAYQLYVDVVQPAGLGLLALQLERLRQQLEAEGLFDPARKRLLPPSPRVIGVVTSPDGAVWHDILNVLGRRYPFVEVVLAPALVQGDRAPAAIISALQALQEDGRAEVIILARGGGSAEDLLAFNDERVARAVFACRVPVVSAVGHETDWSIVDDVADLRAPTPSAAAELCVPSISDIAERLIDLRRRLGRQAAIALDDDRSSLDHLTLDLSRLHPGQMFARHRQRADELVHRAGLRQATILSYARSRLATQRGYLRTVAPEAVLARGYAVLSDAQTGALVSRVADVSSGRLLSARLQDGQVLLRPEAPAGARQ